MGLLTCRDIADKAPSILDGEHGRMMRLRFRAHLVICSACRRYYDQLVAVVGATSQLVRDDEEQDVHDVVDSLMKRLAHPHQHDLGKEDH